MRLVMTSEWKQSPIIECIDLIGGGTPKTSVAEYWDGDIPWLSVKDFNNDYRHVYTTEKHITEEGLNNSSTKLLQKDDIIISARGTVGEMAMIPFPMAFNQSCYGIRAKNGVNSTFLYYLLKNSISKLKLMTHGSVFDTITRDTFATLIVGIPSKRTQDIIAGTLAAIDDKIELNNEINDNLQQQAAALFKSWFVDFEPVSNQGFVNSEIGAIPQGWRVYKLSEFLPVITGKKNANVSSDKGLYPFFSCSQDFAWTNDYSFEGHAILVAGNGDFNVKWYKGKFEAYQRTYVLIPYEERYTSWLYYAVKYNLAKITSAARGSVIKFITKGNLEDFAFAAPSDLLSCEIIDTFTTINRKIDSLTQENYRLAAIRDALLPRLMSGEIDVADIEI